MLKKKIVLKNSKREYIESYIFTPDLLSEKQKKEIKEWLESDKELRRIAEWYSDFEKEIRFVEKNKAKVRPKSSRIQLSPLASAKRKKHTFTLAAQTATVKKKKAGYYTLRTFVSEENKALVRVLRNPGEEKMQIHAISENIEPDDIAMLKIPDITDLMISKPGGIFFPEAGHISDDDVKNWESCTLFISLDRADLLLNSETGTVYLDTHRTDKEQLSISLSEEESHMKVHLKTEQDYRIKKIVLSDGEKGYLLLPENNAVRIPKSLIRKRVTSLFFFN